MITFTEPNTRTVSVTCALLTLAIVSCGDRETPQRNQPQTGSRGSSARREANGGPLEGWHVEHTAPSLTHPGLVSSLRKRISQNPQGPLWLVGSSDGPLRLISNTTPNSAPEPPDVEPNDVKLRLDLARITASVNVRKRPSTSHAMIDELPLGTLVIAAQGKLAGQTSSRGSRGTWTYVFVNEALTGWVAGRFVEPHSGCYPLLHRPKSTSSASTAPRSGSSAHLSRVDSTVALLVAIRESPRKLLAVVKETASRSDKVRGWLDVLSVDERCDIVSASGRRFEGHHIIRSVQVLRPNPLRVAIYLGDPKLTFSWSTKLWDPRRGGSRPDWQAAKDTRALLSLLKTGETIFVRPIERSRMQELGGDEASDCGYDEPLPDLFDQFLDHIALIPTGEVKHEQPSDACDTCTEISAVDVACDLGPGALRRHCRARGNKAYVGSGRADDEGGMSSYAIDFLVERGKKKVLVVNGHCDMAG